MHLFMFQRTWFYLADQGRPHSRYQTMSIIKGTLKHSGNEGKRGFRWRKNGRVQMFKKIILKALKAQQGKGERKGTK